MYTPAQFEESRVEVMQALMRAHPLATLVTQGESALVADHIPVETAAAPAPWGTLRGHIARANPLWRTCRDGAQSLAIFQGPQIYITPSFYPTKRETGEVVPTWDYAVVHARGVLRFIQDAVWLHALVSRLTDAHEVSQNRGPADRRGVIEGLRAGADARDSADARDIADMLGSRT